MAVSARVIKRRIKSTKSTGKIMKAMELVAASKMRRATQLALGTRPYAHHIREMANDLRRRIDPRDYALLVGLGIRHQALGIRTMLVILSSDRGLCGGFNNQLIKKAIEFVKTRGEDAISVVTVGRRAEAAVRRANLKIVASFESISNAPSFARVEPSAKFISEEFLNGRVDRVFIAYTDFKSALSQVPAVQQWLPITPEAELTPEMAPADSVEEDSDDLPTTDERLPFDEPEGELFEPTSAKVLSALLPKMVEMQLYQSFLESAASEHSARMMAMRSAGDAASEMLENLTFTLNQARQAAITREISEISAGAAAIK
ncbi:MAG: ATP synthase F1 subunit gamma [bacterium]|nr:ATP synthase F1 subunit gamma [bacterium]